MIWRRQTRHDPVLVDQYDQISGRRQIDSIFGTPPPRDPVLPSTIKAVLSTQKYVEN